MTYSHSRTTYFHFRITYFYSTTLFQNHQYTRPQHQLHFSYHQFKVPIIYATNQCVKGVNSLLSAVFDANSAGDTVLSKPDFKDDTEYDNKKDPYFKDCMMIYQSSRAKENYAFDSWEKNRKYHCS